MATPSHAVLSAAVDVFLEIEIRDGRRVARQAGEVFDAFSASTVDGMNAAAKRLSRNEFKHCLRMILRRDARLAGVTFPCLQPV
jgi:hypothetical protein